MNHIFSTALRSGAFALFGLLTLTGVASAQPQAGEAVAATVNDNMISTFDVRQRVRLMMLTSGAQVTKEQLPQLQNQALKDLVEEQLKKGEAEKLEFKVNPKEVDQELARIASGSKITVPQLAQQLAQQGIALDTLRDQILTNITWKKLVGARYSSRVNVTEGEIEQVLSRLKEDSRMEQYLVSEICLPVQDPSKVDELVNVGMQMIGQMRQGAPFQAFAQQFSACPSAANGGDLGWVRSGELDPELDLVLSKMTKGAVSRPTPYGEYVYLLAVREKRDAAVAGEPSYHVAYAGADVSIGETRAREGFAKLKKANPCDSEELAVDLGPGIGFAQLPPLPERAIDPAFHPALRSMERGDVSDMIEHNGRYHTVLMCEKDEGFGLPSRAQIEDRLFSQELQLLSRRYLRDLERNAAVEYKINDTAKPTTASQG